MKKIFTLLVSIAMLSTAFAQFGQKGQRDYDNSKDVAVNDFSHRPDKTDDWYRGEYYFTPRERDIEIARINREYDYRIQSVKNRLFMNGFQKRLQISYLQNQREKEIESVFAKFNDRKNKFNDFKNKKRKHW